MSQWVVVRSCFVFANLLCWQRSRSAETCDWQLQCDTVCGKPGRTCLQSLRPLSQLDHRQPQWKWMSHAVLWPPHLICCKHHLIEYQGQTMTVQEPLFQPLTILPWGVKMHFFFPLRYLGWIPETRQTSLQKNGNVTTCYILWCQCINPTQVGGENHMSCVSAHDTCIYLLAHSFCCTSSFCLYNYS